MLELPTTFVMRDLEKMTVGKNKVRDRLFLLLTAVVCSALALGFWRLTGEHGHTIIGSSMLIIAVLENQRLQQRIRALEQRLDRVKEVKAS